MNITAEERTRRLRRIWQAIVVVACPFLAATFADELLRAPLPVRIGAGAVGLLIGLAVAYAIRPKPAPAGFAAPPGTRAFEAYHNALLLEDVIANRRVELHRTPDAARRAHLEREVEHLTKQLVANRAIVAANDLSRGAGHIGFDPYTG